VTFWNWRRGPGPTATQGSAALAAAPELAPIELYTADARIVGWIAPNGQRVTDLLSTKDELRLWRPSPGPLDEMGPPTEADAARADENGEWESLATARVILAMPPEWRASRQLRLHKRLRRAALAAGPFSVTGNIHLQPGVSTPLPQDRKAALAQEPWRVKSISSGIIIDSWYGVNAVRDGFATHPHPCRRLPDDSNKTDHSLTRLSQIKRNADTVFLFDGTFLNLYYEADRVSARHNNRTTTNLLFFDGHAANVPTNSLPGGIGPNAGGSSPFNNLASLQKYPEFRWRMDQP